MEHKSINLELEEQPLDCAICSDCGLLAASLATGSVVAYRYERADAAAERSGNPASTSGRPGGAAAAAPPRWATRPAFARAAPKSGSSARAVAFACDGSSLLAGMSSGTLVQLDAATGNLKRKIPNAHKDAVGRLLGAGDRSLFAAGDDSGGLVVWDMRQKAAAMTYKAHTDFISDLSLRTGPASSGGGGGGQGKAGAGGPAALLASSGDGTLSVHDLRTRRPLVRTDPDGADDELLSVVPMKGGARLVAGAQSGVLNIYTWAAMADCSDRMPGHPESVDALAAWDDSWLISGSSDGIVRLLSIHPNKLLGAVGLHEAGLPVERLALAQDRRLLASLGHGADLKLWDMGWLLDDEDEEDEGEEGEEGRGGGERAAAAGVAAAAAGADTDDSDGPGRKRKRRRGEKTRMTRANNRGKPGGGFFDGLL